MSVINFTKQTNGVKVTKAGVVLHNWIQAPVDVSPGVKANTFRIVFESRDYSFSLSDTIQIEGVGVNGDGIEAICDQLRDSVFINAKSGSGGSGIAVKADDAAAFAALSDGQFRLFEVGGEVSIYIKTSDGTQKGPVTF